MADDLISVIIPCYNDGPYLAEAIESILAQGYDPLEIIVVDDGSTDNSGDVAHSFGDRVHYTFQENQGISAARNTGLKQCKGNIIGFLDADDVWPSNSLAVRLQKLGSFEGATSVYGSVKQFISPDVAEDIKKDLVCPPEVRQGRVAGALILTRIAFEKIGFFKEEFKIGETMDWVARGQESGVTFIGIDDIVMHRRIHKNNTVTKNRQEQGDYLKALKASLDRRRQKAQNSATGADS